MMRIRVGITILSLLMFVTACNAPAADQTKAVTGEAKQVASPAAQGQRYQITPQNSKIEFVGSKVTGSHNGSFQKFSGEVDYTSDVTTSRVRITIDTDSIMADDPKLTQHLKTADFFDVAKYPQATFESTAIKPGGD